MILVNFKIYQETFGERAVKIASIVKEVADKYKIRIIIAASALDAVRIIEKTGVEVWLQNVDQYHEGKHTGWVSPQQAMSLGIKGSLVNHFEHQIPKGTVQKIIKNKPHGFEIICCVKSLGQIEDWVVKSKPDYLLYEPPELIANKEKSVATQESESIKKAVKLCQGIPLIVGAGVKNKKDVEISIKMGAKAVMLASHFVLSDNPKKVLEDIAQGFGDII